MLLAGTLVSLSPFTLGTQELLEREANSSGHATISACGLSQTEEKNKYILKNLFNNFHLLT